MLERPSSRKARRRRDARHRARHRAGIGVAPVLFNADIVDALVRWNPAEVHSREEIGLAMFEVLAGTAKH